MLVVYRFFTLLGRSSTCCQLTSLNSYYYHQLRLPSVKYCLTISMGLNEITINRQHDMI